MSRMDHSSVCPHLSEFHDYIGVNILILVSGEILYRDLLYLFVVDTVGVFTEPTIKQTLLNE